MAGGKVDFSGFNDNQDGMADLMTMPKTITVEEQNESPPQSQPRPASSGGMQSSMTVPERIVINGEQGGYLASKDEIPREMKEDFMPNIFMGGMSTPPRTLTVDDTTSAYYPATKSTSKPNVVKERRNIMKLDERQEVDDESIRTGLEIIEEVKPLMSDSEESFAHEFEVIDLRKSVIRLNKRVAMLEREVEHNGTFGLWSKILFFTFTIINPLILSWVFGRRR